MGNKRSFVRRGAKFGIEGETVTRESSRHQGTVKSEEFEKRRTKEWRQTAAAKIRVGPKNKPFLGTRTVKVKYWEKHQLKIYKKMINEPEESPMYWQDPVQFFGIIYRFWFLHSHTYFSCDEQLMLAVREVWRAVKDGLTKTHLTLFEVRTACYQLRGNYIRLKDLIKLVGPGLLPRANVTSVSLFTGIADVTEFVHRVPIPALRQAMAGLWSRKLAKDARQSVHATSINGMQGTYKGNAYVLTRAARLAYSQAERMGKHMCHVDYYGDDVFSYSFKWNHQTSRQGKHVVHVKLICKSIVGSTAGQVYREDIARGVSSTLKFACWEAMWAVVMEHFFQMHEFERPATRNVTITRNPVVEMIPEFRHHAMQDFLNAMGRPVPQRVIDGVRRCPLNPYHFHDDPIHPFDYRRVMERWCRTVTPYNPRHNSSLNGANGEHTGSDDVPIFDRLIATTVAPIVSHEPMTIMRRVDEGLARLQHLTSVVGDVITSCCLSDDAESEYLQSGESVFDDLEDDLSSWDYVDNTSTENDDQEVHGVDGGSRALERWWDPFGDDSDDFVPDTSDVRAALFRRFFLSHLETVDDKEDGREEVTLLSLTLTRVQRRNRAHRRTWRGLRKDAVRAKEARLKLEEIQRAEKAIADMREAPLIADTDSDCSDLPRLVEDSDSDDEAGPARFFDCQFPSHYLSDDDADNDAGFQVLEDDDNTKLALVGAGKNKGKGNGGKAKGNGQKGQSFVSNSVKNKGKGGGSKQKTDMPAHPPEKVSYAQKVAAGLDNPGGPDGVKPDGQGAKAPVVDESPTAREKRMHLKVNYISSKHIGKRTMHLRPGDVSGEVFDGLGAPFCGITAIDLAVGLRPDVATYLDMVLDDDLDNIPGTIGTDDFLKEYAYSKGVNLRINVPGQPPRDSDNGFDRWIVLRYQGKLPEAQVEGEDPQPQPVGHYVIEYSDQCSLPTYIANDSPPIVAAGWLSGRAFPLTHDGMIRRILKTTESVYDRIEIATMSSTLTSILAMSKLLAGPTGIVSFASAATIVSVLGILYASYRFGRVILENVYIEYTTNFGRKRLARTDRDTRQLMHKRDDVEHQDYITEVEICADVAVDFFGESYKLYDLEDENVVMSDSLYINGLSAMESMASLGKDPYTAAVEVVRHRNINYPAGSGVINGTYRVLKVASLAIESGRSVGNNFVGAVAFAAPGAAAVIPNVGIAAANQVAGVDLARLVGAGAQFEPDMPNHIVKYKLVPEEDETKPVGVYPLGPLYTDDGPVGPGFFATTNSCNTLAAFVGRAMNKERATSCLTADFLQSSMKFLDYYIDSVDLSGIKVGKNTDIFREHYSGKKPLSWIDSKVWEYERFCYGLMSPNEEKKFKRKGFFVKFEHNSKNGTPRQRGIMTMSGQMLIECCPILGIIEAWNHGDFTRFQVKGMTPDEMMAKIMEHTNECYSVSDYSAFESSIDMYLRYLEEYVIRKLLMRAGMADVWDAYVFHAAGNRLLHTKWGIFMIGTRCSGDFWTSFGNGIVNVCAMHFCSEIKGFPFFKMLAEGDDGLLPSGIPDEGILAELGLKFSSEQSGTGDGDCDFLRKRVIGGKFYLSIGKVLTSLLMVKNGHILKRSKQMSVLRCMAHSVYHQSPGHPVLTALVNRIWQETSSYSQPIKSIHRYFDSYEDVNFNDPGLKHVEVDETMRSAIATGAHGFEPMPVAIQLELEKRFSEGFFYVGHLLDNDPDFESKKTSTIVEGMDVGNILDFALDCDEIEFAEKHMGAFHRSCEFYHTF